MSKTMQALFPACASFGPLMLAMGSLFPNRDGAPYGLFVTLPGGLMTTAGLLILFRAMNPVDVESAPKVAGRRPGHSIPVTEEKS